MKTNFLPTATFFVLPLMAVLVPAGGVAIGWRPLQQGTSELQAVVQSNRFSVPIAMLGVLFDEVRDMLVSRVQRKLRWDFEIRRNYTAKTLQGARFARGLPLEDGTDGGDEQKDETRLDRPGGLFAAQAQVNRVGLGAASALLLIAFAIIILWFAGLFMGGRRRGNPPAA